MANPALGRNLGALLKAEPGPRNKSPFAAAEPAADGASGVHSLLRGQRPEKSTSDPAPLTAKPAPTRPSMPRWWFFGADLLLIALALIFLYKGPTPLSPARAAFCVAAIILGGALALTAVLTDRK